MLTIVKRFYSSQFSSESRSAVAILVYKFLIKIISLVYLVRYRKVLKQTEDFIASNRAKILREKKSAFVFANGPSMADIDLEKIQRLCDSGQFDLISINSYLSKSAHIARPTFAVFADNVHFNSSSGQYKADIEKCEELGVTYFAPAKYCESAQGLRYGYCSICNVDSNNTSNILRPAGYYGVTAFFAISLAKMLGYQKIYICGFDNSYFLDFEVEDNGGLAIHHKHYYDKCSQSTRISAAYSGSSGFFFDVYRHFFFLERIVLDKKSAVTNIAKTTYLGAATRDFSLDVYHND